MNIWFGNPIVASLEKGTFYTLDPKELNPIKPGTFWTFYHPGGQICPKAFSWTPEGPKIKFSQKMTQFDPVSKVDIAG